MTSFEINKFVVDVSRPYPVLVEIEYGGSKLRGIKHDELRDLKYAVDKAIKISELKLGKDKAEV